MDWLMDQAFGPESNPRWTCPWTDQPLPSTGGPAADWTGQIGLDPGPTAPTGQSIVAAAWSITESNWATDSPA